MKCFRTDWLNLSVGPIFLFYILFPSGGTNTCSAYCYVINQQKYLDDFASSFQQMEALSFLKKIRISVPAAPADLSICSKWFDFVLFYHSDCSITLYILLVHIIFLPDSYFLSLFFFFVSFSSFSLYLLFLFYILFFLPPPFLVFNFCFVSLSPFFLLCRSLSLFLPLSLPFLFYFCFSTPFFILFLLHFR